MKNNSTLKHIAQELGISISTVSRALNGKSVVKEETRQKISEVAKKYAYTPNEIARSLQKSSTETIAVVLPDISENFFATIVAELERITAKHGYMIILADTHEKPDKEQNYLDMLFKRRIDALVLATVVCNGSSAKTFIDNDIPVVFIDNMPTLPDIDAVTVDNCAASHIAIDYLMSFGHKNIATIIGSKEETTGTDRLSGYKKAIAKNGLALNEELIVYGDYKLQSGYDAMSKLLDNIEKSPFTAVYVTSEKMTYGALRAIYDRGLRVPDDISVVGFDIHNMLDFKQQKITSVCQPEQNIGQMVGKLLIDRLNENTNSEKKRHFLAPFLVEGDTVKKI